jgi:hypothetical protein
MIVREPYTAEQHAAGARAAAATMDHGAYSYAQAAAVARCYVDHTPTIPRSPQ